MRHTLSLLALAIGGAAIAAPAQAQEFTPEQESWTGVYVGGTFGLAAQKNDRGETVVFDTDRNGTFDNNVNTAAGSNAFAPGFCNGAASGALAGNCRNDKDDFEYSIRVGADQQSGNIVYGFVVDATKSEATDSVTAFSSTPASYTFTRELDWAVGARGRLGLATRGVLFYGTGGVTYGRIKNSFETTNGANSFTANDRKSESWGYTVGGGAEAKILPNLTMGLEYLYTRFRDDDYRVAVGRGTAPATNPFLLVSGGTDLRRSDRSFATHGIRLTTALRF